MRYCKPPHPDPRRPRLRLPPGACDAHCHVFGPADRFPYAPGRTYTPPDSPKARLKALHDRLGIERAVLVQASCHGTDNRATLDAIAASGGRYRGVAIVDPAISDAGLAALDRGGIRAARFNFVAHLGGTPDLPAFERMLARIAPLGWHVVLHLDAADILDHAERIKRIRMPFVIDHMCRIKAKGGIDQLPFRMLLELMRNPNACVKISGAERITEAGPPYRDVAPFAAALVAAAPARVLWGTDFPHPNVEDMPDDGDLVDLLAELVPDDALRRRILVDNPARLYGFPD